jgi:putative AlgH/UPF0301 family transcriptional regulator
MSRQKLAGWAMLAAAVLLLFAADYFDLPPNTAHRKLLLTTEKVTDARFEKAVIFVVAQEKHSSMGLILNHPAPDGEAFVGGPMEQDKWVYALHTLDAAIPETRHLKEINLGIVVGRKNIDKLLSQNPRPKWSRVLKGYCGWAKRGLVRDLDKGYWEVIEFDDKLVMETPPDAMWTEAAKRPRIKP